MRGSGVIFAVQDTVRTGGSADSGHAGADRRSLFGGSGFVTARHIIASFVGIAETTGVFVR